MNYKKYLRCTTIVGSLMGACSCAQAVTAFEQCKDKEWIVRTLTYQGPGRTRNLNLSDGDFIFGNEFNSVEKLNGWIGVLAACNLRTLSPLIQMITEQRNILVQKQEEVRRTEEEIRKAELRHQEDIKRQQEENLKQQQLALQHQQELRRQKEEEIQRQQELARIEQLKQQETFRLEQMEAQRQQDEKKRQQDEACRTRCPDQLAAMLEELRSLVLDEKGIERFNQLRRGHKDLVSTFPSDVKEALKPLDDRFIALLDKKMAEARIAEEERKRAEENFKRVKQVEEDLRILYGMQLILQFCTERHSEFNNSKIELERLIKSQ